ncbi:histone-lysine N-methyltransferase, H3 lysine-9 specific SUVH5-like isoform X2 [Lycium barbarum]|nr:histone-lysine N-methyltransferase, H3 lysine-9 specific SUVH5-like isoform X2 [Lycium barbarum]
MLGKRVYQSVDTRSPSTFKHLKVDTTRTFPENCGPFVREKSRSRIPIYPEFPSTTKRVKVDSMRNFPEKCGPCVPQKKIGSGTQCSVDAEIKSCSEVAMNVIESAEPISVFVPTEWEAEEKDMQIDFPPILGQAKKNDFVATGVPPEEVGNSSHVKTSCQPTNGNQKKNLMQDESTQQHRCDWSIKVGPIENGPELPAIVAPENLIGSRTEPSKETSRSDHHEKISDDESRSGVDDDEICILSPFEWNSLNLTLKFRSAGKKDGKGEIMQAKASRCLESLGKCMIDTEDAVDFEPDWDQCESIVNKKPIHTGVSQEDSRNSAVMCGVSNHGLLTESLGKCMINTEDAVDFEPDWDQCESIVNKKPIHTGVSQEDSRNSAVMCGVSNHGLLTEYEHTQKVKEVRETLKLFDDLYTKLLRENKAEKHEGQSKRCLHIEAAMSLKNQKKWVNCEWNFGHVPGVKIGDQFRFRAELVMIGLHHQFIKGIDYANINGKDVATSIVDSGRYENEALSSQTFIYVGQGGNPKVYVNARMEDQKLERGNLALKNSVELGNPVRVICGRKRMNGKKSDIRYIYDGLYTVTKCWQEKGPTGKYVFKFELKRNLDQPKLTRELVSRPANLGKVNHFRANVNKARKSVTEVMQSEFVVDYDVSQGKEKLPIPAVNAMDDEKPPPFTYITIMQYPDWFYISRPQGCSCTSGCSDSKQCCCTSRNGGEIPFNKRGSVIRAKPLVHECGPSCKCPPSCKNRVSQHGPLYHLEVFKTESRGWGLRSRDNVSSGSFICEYVGELLDEKEAEIRTDHDEYLFDVGNYDEEFPKRNAMRNKKFKVESNSVKRKDEDGFTLDAAKYGNVGRFINHSCSPNLYAQNVMYDHGDRRVPHVMFFASESIAPLEELTYHYNYQIDHVYDKNGNLKRKDCRCGSRKCEGRMY